MNFSTLVSLSAFQVAAFAGGLACILWLRRQVNSSHGSLAALLGATALANLANGIELLDEAHALFWRQTAMAAELAQPAALLYVGLAFLNPAQRWADSSVLWRPRITGIVGLVLAVLVVTGEAFRWKAFEDGQAVIVLAAWGRLPYVFIIVGMALGLAQLELVLRASREPFRHKLKFVVIGLGGLAGYQIYQASQMLLFPVWRSEHVLIASLVTTVALGLVAFGLARTRLRQVFVNTYISQQALLGSITFISIGLYLLAVGAVGQWLRHTNQPLGVGLSIVVVFGALVGLAIAAFSKTVRAEIRRFIARNFYRSKYDYRARWLEVTEAFQQATDREAIMDRLLDLLIRTFPTTSISIWSFREADRRFSRIRSMTMGKEPTPLELSHPVIRQLLKQDEPVLIEECLGTENGEVGLPSDSLTVSGTALCFPIRAQGQLVAFVALGKQLHGEAYATDDCDLLSGISHHVGALLSHATLAEERQASAELEALHRFSVFCLHDLKNLAARLSLVAQNAEHHGVDPAFQESAMRTVSDTAKKIIALVSKLSLRSVKPASAGAQELLEISALVEEVVAPIKGKGLIRFQVIGGPVQPIIGVRDQLQQVFLNVILNARQATGENGDISISIEQLNGSVVVTVNDTGSGIPSDMLESLFRPSQSSRPGGLGVGLYQCKQIVEANRGTIQLRSEVGKGTQVRIELPLPRPSGSREDNVMVHSAMP
jgi:putative PEP-CTERM system histidine kinase